MAGGVPRIIVDPSENCRQKGSKHNFGIVKNDWRAPKAARACEADTSVSSTTKLNVCRSRILSSYTPLTGLFKLMYSGRIFRRNRSGTSHYTLECWIAVVRDLLIAGRTSPSESFKCVFKCFVNILATLSLSGFVKF